MGKRQPHARGRGFGHRPGAHPAIAVQAMWMVAKIQRQLIGLPVQHEAALVDTVSIGDQWIGGDGATVLRAQPFVAHRAQDVQTAPGQGGDRAAR